jgi:hypothetical protein
MHSKTRKYLVYYIPEIPYAKFCFTVLRYLLAISGGRCGFILESVYMPVKLFILGRPGSGKSHAARYFELDVKIRDGSSFRINDYEFLKRQFIFDKDHIRFVPVGDKGFVIRDFTVLDEALVNIREKASACCESEMYDLVIIEFARTNYSEALQKFGKRILQDAYFLFIDADLTTCFERIQIRAADPQFPDDIFVPKEALDLLYTEDNRLYMSVGLATEFELQDRQIRCIDNMGSIEEFEAQLTEFIQIFQERIGQSPETDPAQFISTAVLDCQVSK